MPEDEQPMTVRLPRDLYERLRKVAFDRREPMSVIIIEGARREVARRESEDER
jgi:predicted transcriptional regulator